jgi:hypothetical protein
MKGLAAGLLLTVLAAAPAIAGGPIPWGGVGWYVKVSENYQGAQPYAVSGPYPSKEACEVEIARAQSQNPTSTYSRWCNYETVAWASPDDDY